MGLLIANDNLLTALGITNKEQFDQTFADFSEFETFVEKCGYEYDFDEEGNLILITPKSKEINTGINGFKPDKNYFYVEALEDETTFTFTWETASLFEFYYSFNGISWFKKDSTFTLPLNANQKVFFKGDAISYNYQDQPKKSKFNCDKLFNVGGDLLSLFYLDDFEGKHKFPTKSNYSNGYNCSHLFYQAYKLVSSKDLIFNAGYADTYCYSSMFEGCSRMTEGPKSIVKPYNYSGSYVGVVLDIYCFQNMFKGCSSLIKPVEELDVVGTSGYDTISSIYQNCSSLIETPILNEGSNGSSSYIFNGCSSLNKIYIKNGWNQDRYSSYCFYGVPATGTLQFVNDISQSPVFRSYFDQMSLPNTWTIIDKDGNSVPINENS